MFRMLLVLDTKTRVESSHSGVTYSQQFVNCSRADLEDLIFDSCPDCIKAKMSSMPQGAFVAKKVQSNNVKHQAWEGVVSMIGRNGKSTPNPTYNQVNTQDLDHPLTKYNSKLMNSIWGMYNRYSVHNLKKITEGEIVPPGVEQLNAAATPTSLGLGLKGGFKNGSIANQAREVLWKNSHAYHY